MPSWPAQLLLKAILVPSGDHAGELTQLPGTTTWFPEPSTFITQMPDAPAHR